MLGLAEHHLIGQQNQRYKQSVDVMETLELMLVSG